MPATPRDYPDFSLVSYTAATSPGRGRTVTLAPRVKNLTLDLKSYPKEILLFSQPLSTIASSASSS